MYIFTAIKNILVNPKAFFEDKRHSQYGFRGAIFYGFILSVFSGLIRYAYVWLTHGFDQLGQNEGVQKVSTLTHLSIDSLTLISIIALGVFMFIALLITPLFIHLGMKVMKGTGSLTQTYQAYIFGSTPALLFGAFPFLGFVGIVYGLYIKVIGLSTYHTIRFDHTIVGYIIGRIIDFFVSIMVAIIIVLIFALILFTFFKGIESKFPMPIGTSTPALHQNSVKTI